MKELSSLKLTPKEKNRSKGRHCKHWTPYQRKWAKQVFGDYGSFTKPRTKQDYSKPSQGYLQTINFPNEGVLTRQ
jgi:hypothetical protein